MDSYQASAPSSDFIDAQTGRVKRFETPAEHALGETLPLAGRYAALATKVIVASSFIPGGLLVAAPVAAGLIYFANKSFAAVREKSAALYENGGAYDLSKPIDRKALEIGLPGLPSGFCEAYIATSKQAGFEKPPYIVLNDDPESQGYYGASAQNAHPRGLIEVGCDFATQLDLPAQMAVMGHEMTHLKLKHHDKRVAEVPRKALTILLSVATLGAAVAGALPLLPAVAFVVAGSFAEAALESATLRHREKVCDRGAFLLTGEGTGLTVALKKISARMHDNFSHIKNSRFIFDRLRRMESFLAGKILPAKTIRTLYRGYPALKTRESLLHQLESGNAAFCTTRREEMRVIFNKAAAKPHGLGSFFTANTLKNQKSV